MRGGLNSKSTDFRFAQVMGVPEGEGGYTVVPDAADGCYFPGRAASVFWRGNKVGGYGVVHPEVSPTPP